MRGLKVAVVEAHRQRRREQDAEVAADNDEVVVGLGRRGAGRDDLPRPCHLALVGVRVGFTFWLGARVRLRVTFFSFSHAALKPSRDSYVL